MVAAVRERGAARVAGADAEHRHLPGRNLRGPCDTKEAPAAAMPSLKATSRDGAGWWWWRCRGVCGCEVASTERGSSSVGTIALSRAERPYAGRASG